MKRVKGRTHTHLKECLTVLHAQWNHHAGTTQTATETSTIKLSRAAPSPKDTIKPGGIQTLFEWKKKSNTRQQTTAAPLVNENVCRHTKPTEEPALELTNTISRLISCSSVRSGAGSGHVSIPFFTHFSSWPDLEGGASPRGCDVLQTAELAAGKLHLRMDVIVVLAFQVSPLVPLWLRSQSNLTTSHTVVCVLSCLWASRRCLLTLTDVPEASEQCEALTSTIKVPYYAEIHFVV